MADNIIAMRAVSKSYSENIRVLDHVDLELKRGEFVYLLGGTGTGKSSLLRMLATEEVPTSGTVSLFGYSLSRCSDSALRAIRQAIGYIPQDIRLISDFTVFENVALSVSLGGRRALPAQARSRITDLLERLDLGTKRNQLARSLSGGEAQRVAVARALVRSPELIIADEPTGAQDRDATWGLMDLLLKANLNGTTIVLATHDREIVQRVRKRCAILRSGRLSVEEAVCIY